MHLQKRCRQRENVAVNEQICLNCENRLRVANKLVPMDNKQNVQNSHFLESAFIFPLSLCVKVNHLSTCSPIVILSKSTSTWKMRRKSPILNETIEVYHRILPTLDYRVLDILFHVVQTQTMGGYRRLLPTLDT